MLTGHGFSVEVHDPADGGGRDAARFRGVMLYFVVRPVVDGTIIPNITEGELIFGIFYK